MPTPEGQLTFGESTPVTDRRLRELILYIVNKCGDAELFGATKLNKILYYSDFEAFARLEQSITGVTYQKLPKGPAPKRLRPAQEALESDGYLTVTKRLLRSGYEQTRFKAHRAADLSLFSREEIALVDSVVDRLGSMSAGEVSDASHEMPWKLTAMYDRIPYEFVFLADREPTESDREWAAEVAERFQLA
jgi:hypothetical protein